MGHFTALSIASTVVNPPLCHNYFFCKSAKGLLHVRRATRKPTQLFSPLIFLLLLLMFKYVKALYNGCEFKTRSLLNTYLQMPGTILHFHYAISHALRRLLPLHNTDVVFFQSSFNKFHGSGVEDLLAMQTAQVQSSLGPVFLTQLIWISFFSVSRYYFFTHNQQYQHLHQHQCPNFQETSSSMPSC